LEEFVEHIKKNEDGTEYKQRNAMSEREKLLRANKLAWSIDTTTRKTPFS
jgi:hypothetical protein